MRWIVKHGIIAFLTIYVSMSFSFFVVRSMPGNPIQALIQILIQQYYMSYQEAQAMALALAPFIPKGPLIYQYFTYVFNFFRGNFGVSISVSTGTPVIELLAYAIPWTVFVVSIALIISFSAGILIGMFMAYRRGGALDSSLLAFFSVLRSVPEYIYAILYLSILGFQLSLFPVRGRCSYQALVALQHGNVLFFISDALWHAAMPILAWITTHIGGWALGMRGSTIGILGEYFIDYAKARGLSERRIVTRYVGRNAILPLFTSFMLSIGFMLGGSIIIEYIFAYQGVGLLLYQAIEERDWYLMLGAFNMIIIAVVIGAFLADLLYGYLDPRIRREAA